MPFALPQLAYPYDALEPHIDKETMEIHHTKHHQAYLDNFVKVIENYPELAAKTPEDILRELNSLPVNEEDRQKIKNHGGGFVNHNIYFSNMSPEKAVDENLVKEIKKVFNSLEAFKEKFSTLAKTHFASGWAWLVRDENNNPQAYSLPNQDSPYTLGHTPIFCIDVWEHAYYLKYQNKRADYVDNWWSVLKII